jgi:hypothetical protein
MNDELLAMVEREVLCELALIADGNTDNGAGGAQYHDSDDDPGGAQPDPQATP